MKQKGGHPLDARLFLELNEAKTENLKFPQCLGAHLTGQRPVGAFAPYKRFDAGKTSADCARRRVSERNRREGAALGAEMGGFAALSIKIPKGVAAFGRRNPKRKDILSDVLSFWWTIQGSDL